MQNDNFWLRQCVLVAETAGEPLSISELRMTFEVRKTDVQTPNLCTLRIYNPSQTTIAALQTKLLPIKLYAGYKNNVALIFSGNIVEATQKWEKTDIILELFAADGDRAYVYGTVSKTLTAGCTYSDQVNVCLKSFAEKGVGSGYIPDLGGPASPRGVVMYGQANSYMRDLAKDTNTSWSIQDGKVQMIPLNGYLPGEPVVLSSETGLLSVEEKEIHYIILNCLLNPLLHIGGRLKIDNASALAQKNSDYLAIRPPSTEHDGLYRIISITHKGDTHGTSLAWISEVNSLIIDSTSGKPLDMIANIIPPTPAFFKPLVSLSSLNCLSTPPSASANSNAPNKHAVLKQKNSEDSTRLLIMRDLVQSGITFNTREMWDEKTEPFAEKQSWNYKDINVQLLETSSPNGLKKNEEIAWHYIIDKTGTIYEGKAIRHEAKASAVKNARSIAVLCLGPFTDSGTHLGYGEGSSSKKTYTANSIFSVQTALGEAASEKQKQTLALLRDVLAKYFPLPKAF